MSEFGAVCERSLSVYGVYCIAPVPSGGVKCKADLGGRSCANTPYLACCRVDDIGVPRLLTEGGTIIELGLDVLGCSFLLK